MIPLRLLLSREAAQRFGARVGEILHDRRFEIVHLESEPDAHGDFGIDIGFISTDVRGNSTNVMMAPTLRRFFEMAAASHRLRWIHTNSAGADRPEYRPLQARGVTLTTSSGATAATIALSVTGAVIALAREFPAILHAQRQRAWIPLRGERTPRDLAGQTALVVGLGPIGREIARLLKAIGLRVVGVRRSPQPVEHCDATLAFAQMREALPRADWVILACPLSDVTRGLIDAEALRLLPRGARLLNVSRGAVVDEAALIEALRSGQLGGAYLDVFTREPLAPESPLWTLPNVIVSPHSSSYSEGYADRVGEIFLDNLTHWRDGLPLRNVVEASEVQA
jgi:phosphoglycerate dehydrogenase-like enzyme